MARCTEALRPPPQRGVIARRLAIALFAAGSALLAGCAAPQLQPSAAHAAAQPPEQIVGRISLVRGQPPQAMYGGFRLVLEGDGGRFDLFSPLGQMLAQASWNDGGARVDDGRSVQRYPSFTAMTQAVLGIALPRAALQDWVQGRPAAGLPSQPLAGGGFEQLGWAVQAQRRDGRLALIDARRDGDDPAQLRLAITDQSAVSGAPAGAASAASAATAQH